MAEADKLVVVLAVGPQAADGHRHAVFQHPVQPGLGPVRLLKIVKELLGSEEYQKVSKVSYYSVLRVS